MGKVSLAIAILLLVAVMCWISSAIRPIKPELTKKSNSLTTPEKRDLKCLTNGCPKIAYIMGNNALTILSKQGWVSTRELQSATLIWCRKHTGIKHEKRSQIINQIPSPLPISDKAFMCKHTRYYERQHGLTDTRLPETILMTTTDEMRWISSFSKKDESKGIWIVKRTSQSMGRGIIIVENMSTWVRTQQFSVIALEIAAGERFVCQRYIRNPLLLNGRKSELRMYWNIASLNPLIVAVHNEGQVRLNSEAYEEGDYSNPRKHLTNAHQQKDHPEYKEMMATGKLKWTFDHWRSHLISTGVSTEVIDRMFGNMKLAIVRSVNATRNHLMGKSNTIGMFEMFGADFIIDDQFNVYLTEIQQGPGLSFTDPVKGRIITSAVNGAVDMAYEIMTRRQQNQTIGNITTPLGYQIVINEGTKPKYYLQNN